MFRIGEDRLWWRGLKACGLVLLLCLLLAPGALAQRGVVHLRVRQTATQSLTLITPSDPIFDGTIDSYFPGLSGVPGYQTSIRPFLVIVRNDTVLPAVAYAIMWTVHYSNGSAYPLRAIFVNRPLMNQGATTYVRPGDVRLIAPMFNVTPREYAGDHSFTQFYPAKVYPGSEDLASVDVDVDGVVYNDGSFIGPDKTNVLERYVMARFAARDEVLATLKFIQSFTASQATIVQPLAQILSQHVQWGSQANQGGLLARYIRARGRSAQDLEGILRSRGVSYLETVLRNFASANTNSSMFGRVYQKLSANSPRVLGTVP